MKLDATTVKSIISTQKNNSILKNELLLISLLLANKKPIIIKLLQDEGILDKDKIEKCIEILSSNGSLARTDMELISKIEKTKVKTIKNFDDEIKEINDHLNQLCGTKKGITNLNKSMMLIWLNRGYSVNCFKQVNTYFHHMWAEDPTMCQFVRAETLYNTKFESRLEQAKEAFEKLGEYYLQIKQIWEYYNKVIEESTTLEKQKTLSFAEREKIVFWLKKGNSVKNICATLKVTILAWMNKNEFIPFICIEKILDKKFPERLKIALNQQSKNTAEQSCVKNKEWIKKNTPYNHTMASA